MVVWMRGGSEEADQGKLDDSNYVRTVNALQRLYFTVMKDGIGPCMHGALVGLRTFIKLIRMVSRVGLCVLLNDSVKTCDVKTKLLGVDTILAIYGDSGLDFRWIIDMDLSILHPLDSELQSGDYAQVQWIIKQPLVRINALIQRLMQARIVRSIPQYAEMIRTLEIVYDVDFADHDIRAKNMYDPDNTDIDKIETKPFYEYHLFRKVI